MINQISPVDSGMWISREVINSCLEYVCMTMSMTRFHVCRINYMDLYFKFPPTAIMAVGGWAAAAMAMLAFCLAMLSIQRDPPAAEDTEHAIDTLLVFSEPRSFERKRA